MFSNINGLRGQLGIDQFVEWNPATRRANEQPLRANSTAVLTILYQLPPSILGRLRTSSRKRSEH
jgi:hypothetical protein